LSVDHNLTKEEVRRRICETAIIPVVRASRPDLAVAAARAICAGGIRVVEITMTVPCAIDVIAELTRQNGMLVGAGTILDAATARHCIDAGAEFLVSPVLDRATVNLAKDEGKLMMAGGLTPVEVVDAWNSGADFVKVFPCNTMGGVAYIKTLKTVFPHIDMVPTGGVNLANADSFLKAGAAAVGVGGEMILSVALEAGDFASIEESARRFADVARGVRKI
jgi:2-dehydro-3-deoxyphosphogluconate aldolase/(4S)-4-hydroxy-2-oxoglutarate aldolase